MDEKTNIIEIFKKEESIDNISRVITFKTGLKDIVGPGEIGILTPEENNTDKIILNPLYKGGELLVKMRVISLPAKMYKEGDKIANLLIVR